MAQAFAARSDFALRARSLFVGESLIKKCGSGFDFARFTEPDADCCEFDELRAQVSSGTG